MRCGMTANEKQSTGVRSFCLRFYTVSLSTTPHIYNCYNDKLWSHKAISPTFDRKQINFFICIAWYCIVNFEYLIYTYFTILLLFRDKEKQIKTKMCQT